MRGPVNIERNLSEQPMAKIMAINGLKAGDLVKNSTEQITYKMISRAVKGRRLTPAVRSKILNALNKASKRDYVVKDLFNYQ